MLRLPSSPRVPRGPAFAAWAGVAVFAATLLTGCGLTSNQRTGLATFTASTTALADGMSGSFVQTRDDLIVLRSGMLELGLGSVRLADPAADLDGPLDVDQVERRLKTAVALRRFAELLDALTADTQGPRIRRLADRFLEGSAVIEGVNLPPEKANAIAAVVTKIGGLWVEHKRKVAVKQIVRDTQPVLRRLVELVAEDFDPGRMFWGAGACRNPAQHHEHPRQPGRGGGGRRASRRRRERAQVDGGGGGPWHSRYAALRIEAGIRLDNTARTSTQIRETLDRAQRAHDELSALMEAPDFELGHVQDYAAEVEELARLVSILTNHGRN